MSLTCISLCAVVGFEKHVTERHEAGFNNKLRIEDTNMHTSPKKHGQSNFVQEHAESLDLGEIPVARDHVGLERPTNK